MIEDVYRAHYSEVRKRLIGAPVNPLKQRILNWREELKKDMEERERKEAKKQADIKRLLDEAVIRYAATMTGPISWVKIGKQVAIEHNISYKELMTAGRKTNVVEARQEAWLRTKEAFPEMSLPEIGRRYGKDHTTVLHGIRRARERRLQTGNAP